MLCPIMKSTLPYSSPLRQIDNPTTVLDYLINAANKKGLIGLWLNAMAEDENTVHLVIAGGGSDKKTRMAKVALRPDGLYEMNIKDPDGYHVAETLGMVLNKLSEWQAPKIKTPTVHLNGTAAKTLFYSYLDAKNAVDLALKRITEVEFHGRDYYPQEQGAFETARVQHQKRLDALRTVSEELLLIAQSIQDQAPGKL